MLMITMQKAKSPSYVTIRTTPFRWGVANRLTVVTVFPASSVPGNDNFGNDSLGGWVFPAAFCVPVSPCRQVPTQMGVARWLSWCVDAVPCQKHIGAGYCARTNGVQYP